MIYYIFRYAECAKAHSVVRLIATQLCRHTIMCECCIISYPCPQNICLPVIQGITRLKRKIPDSLLASKNSTFVTHQSHRNWKWLATCFAGYREFNQSALICVFGVHLRAAPLACVMLYHSYRPKLLPSYLTVGLIVLPCG